ncbi:glutamic acid-rich protein-like [Papaver somniferum]|uniref:glutamic acid-rich protein-like n=1 Tax=Papaver somniferum TaxID=3469 RepID=UPI000E701FDB|nr:glutamic acid-rich protein-like [Papaver somniferum]
MKRKIFSAGLFNLCDFIKGRMVLRNCMAKSYKALEAQALQNLGESEDEDEDSDGSRTGSDGDSSSSDDESTESPEQPDTGAPNNTVESKENNVRGLTRLKKLKKNFDGEKHVIEFDKFGRFKGKYKAEIASYMGSGKYKQKSPASEHLPLSSPDNSQSKDKTELSTIGKCKLAHASLRNIIAWGSVLPSVPGQKVHGDPLRDDCVRVTVEKSILKNHCLPVPSTHLKTVEDAEKSIVAWPKEFVLVVEDSEELENDDLHTDVSEAYQSGESTLLTTVEADDIQENQLQRDDDGEYETIDVDFVITDGSIDDEEEEDDTLFDYTDDLPDEEEVVVNDEDTDIED